MSMEMNVTHIKRRIREFILENYMFGYDENDLGNDASFLELGILDSTGIMELVSFVECEFNIEVLDSEILPENLDSIDCISNYVYKKVN